MSSHEIGHLVHQYGCLLIFMAAALQALGPPVPGTTALVAGALYAATAHGLPIEGVIAAGASGALAGTTAGFGLGRWGGERLLLRIGSRLGQNPERVITVRRDFAVHGGGWLLVGRFISGVRNVIGLLAGASGMPLKRFLPLSAAAATAWALVNGLGSYWFGHALAGAGTWVQIAMVCVGVVWMLISLSLLRRRLLKRVRGSSVAELS